MMSLPENYLVYKRHEERGEFTAHVENSDGDIIWEYRFPEEGVVPPDEQTSIFDDGFMKHMDDVAGLEEYLKTTHRIPASNTIISESEAISKYGHYAKGGKIGFDGLAEKVAESYVGKPVPKKYQAEYGKTYSEQEAEEVGKKVAGKVYREQQDKKMEEGGHLSATPYKLSKSKQAKFKYSDSDGVTLLSKKILSFPSKLEEGKTVAVVLYKKMPPEWVVSDEDWSGVQTLPSPFKSKEAAEDFLENTPGLSEMGMIVHKADFYAIIEVSPEAVRSDKQMQFFVEESRLKSLFGGIIASMIQKGGGYAIPDGSGYKAIAFTIDKESFEAGIYLDGKCLYSESFDTMDEAIERAEQFENASFEAKESHGKMMHGGETVPTKGSKIEYVRGNRVESGKIVRHRGSTRFVVHANDGSYVVISKNDIRRVMPEEKQIKITTK